MPNQHFKNKLWEQKCKDPNNYFCVCKICQSARYHAKILEDEDMINEIIRKRKGKKFKPKIGIKYD